jgi:hypothetical protein
MSVFTGLPYPGDTVEPPPVFSLYGDGHVIYTDGTTVDETHRADLWHAQLTPAQADELIGFALDDGGLANARRTYDLPGVYDVASTQFQIDASGGDKSVFVWGLGAEPYASVVPDSAARRAFTRLAARLRNFGSAVRAGEYQDLGRWSPPAYRITLVEPWTEMSESAAWPWPGLTADDFKPNADGDLILFATPEQGKNVLDLGITSDLVVRAPGGNNYVVRVLPLVLDPGVE